MNIKIRLFLTILLPNIAFVILFTLLILFIPYNHVLFLPFLILIVLALITIVLAASLLSSSMIFKPINELYSELKVAEKEHKTFKPSKSTPKELLPLAKAVQMQTMLLKQADLEKKKSVENLTKEIEEKDKKLKVQEEATVEVLKEVEKEKKISEVIAQDLKKYKLAVDKASDHILITDHNGVILYSNNAGELITGYEAEEMLDKETHKFWPELMTNEFWNELKKNKQNYKGDVKNKRKNGEEYIAEINISPILNKDSEVIFFVVMERDVTLAKEVDRMKTEFISLASHQLRTPLTSMKWGLEAILGDDFGNLNEKQREYITDIYTSNSRLIGLVGGLLNVSRIESGRILVEPKNTDIKAMIEDIVKELKVKAQDKNVEISVISEEIPSINIDPKLVREIYLNLIGNAIKYSPEGKKVEIKLSKQDEQIISEIKDEGIGIPENQKQDIFNKFFRAENALKMIPDGTGLGLYLAKSLVELMDGVIWFESEEGKGTTFWFTLPTRGVKPQKGEVTIV